MALSRWIAPSEHRWLSFCNVCNYLPMVFPLHTHHVVTLSWRKCLSFLVLFNRENLPTIVGIYPEHLVGTRFVAVDDMLAVVSCSGMRSSGIWEIVEGLV